MKNIVLIGFMGCGKTSVGKALAAATKAQFVDTDESIVNAEEKSINEIFAESGEKGFREIETTILRGIGAMSGKGLIISTGGGIVTTPENIPLLKKAGAVVWLRVKPETVIKRLAGDTTRPLLAGDNPEEKVRKLMEQRKAMYEAAADITIDVDDMTVEAIVKKTCNLTGNSVE